MRWLDKSYLLFIKKKNKVPTITAIEKANKIAKNSVSSAVVK